MGNREAELRLCFCNWDGTKFQASSQLSRLACVRPGQKTTLLVSSCHSSIDLTLDLISFFFLLFGIYM